MPMNPKYSSAAVFLFLLFLAAPIGAADLGVSKIEAVGGSLRCDLILTVQGDLEKAGGFMLDVYWTYDDSQVRHKRAGTGGQMGQGFHSQLKNPKVDAGNHTLTFHTSLKKAGERRGRCILSYTLDGVAKKAPEVTTSWFKVAE